VPPLPGSPCRRRPGPPLHDLPQEVFVLILGCPLLFPLTGRSGLEKPFSPPPKRRHRRQGALRRKAHPEHLPSFTDGKAPQAFHHNSAESLSLTLHYQCRVYAPLQSRPPSPTPFHRGCAHSAEVQPIVYERSGSERNPTQSYTVAEGCVGGKAAPTGLVLLLIL
jgi:hypothetical protein